jgi:hypothetical protein
VSDFNYFVKNITHEFMLVSAREIIARTDPNSIIDLELEFGKILYIRGIKTGSGACVVFATEKQPHNNLVLLAKCILFRGMADTIEANYQYINTEIKCEELQKDLDNIKYTMLNNIEMLLSRGEKLDELVAKHRY